MLHVRHALKNKSVRSSAKEQRGVATFNVLMTFLIVINVLYKCINVMYKCNKCFKCREIKISLYFLNNVSTHKQQEIFLC